MTLHERLDNLIRYAIRHKIRLELMGGPAPASLVINPPDCGMFIDPEHYEIWFARNGADRLPLVDKHFNVLWYPEEEQTLALYIEDLEQMALQPGTTTTDGTLIPTLAEDYPQAGYSLKQAF